ncbi:MAG: ribosome biogenesis GTP-binding protein YihA/YsxC [Bacteroidota bacterium]
MNVASATFVKSSTTFRDCPEPKIPEYAFIGRSNVGKSSLINSLVNQKSLAKTSGTPGKTQLINHFLVNDGKDPWYLVDLPGYGYAKAPKKEREKWMQFIREYFRHRENLVGGIVLVDARHTPQKIDLDFMEWLGENGVPFVMVFTKVDKLSSSQRAKSLRAYQTAMLKIWEEMPTHFDTSSETRLGRQELLNFIEGANESFYDS